MLNAAELAGVAQLGQSVRLIIERSRARVPPPAPRYVTTKEDKNNLIAKLNRSCKPTVQNSKGIPVVSAGAFMHYSRTDS